MSRPGEADMSAHVDFAALMRAGREAGAAIWGPVPQGEWLRRLGIEARADRLGGQEAALARLTGEDAMGRLFRAAGLRSRRSARRLQASVDGEGG